MAKYDLVCGGANVLKETYDLVKYFKSEDAKTERLEIEADFYVSKEKEITERERIVSMERISAQEKDLEKFKITSENDMKKFLIEQNNINKKNEQDFYLKLEVLKIYAGKVSLAEITEFLKNNNF
ncbi:MAG: hypothetical protein SOR81_01535 [Fusobacterium sp.]|uniref:hypothetical protein n=1 Tax=Fusobacterium sp. TaxID=68766 RepID=UPI002A754B0B|nr:hypothetical protein [Fusobacterium sp.]MDY2980281.1 hypothetical protein [Fusobacterium sp.]